MRCRSVFLAGVDQHMIVCTREERHDGVHTGHDGEESYQWPDASAAHEHHNGSPAPESPSDADVLTSYFPERGDHVRVTCNDGYYRGEWHTVLVMDTTIAAVSVADDTSRTIIPWHAVRSIEAGEFDD